MKQSINGLLLVCMVVAGCGRQPATVGPTTSEITGHYTTTDSRASATTLDLRADGTFTLANWPQTNGSGTWSVSQNDVTTLWELRLVFMQPKIDSENGHQVLGGPGDYRLGLFLGDPDEGAVVLEKQKP